MDSMGGIPDILLYSHLLYGKEVYANLAAR